MMSAEMSVDAESYRERFAALFYGNQDHHGTHGKPDWDEQKQKWKIKSTAQTIPGAVTTDHWKAHLEGRRPLGVVPIRRDSTCSWGSIDIDDYELDAVEVIIKVRRLKYPLIPCRSKSGGLHLFLFLREPESAAAVSKKLKGIAAALGYPDAEIFPKQEELSDAGAHGSWILLPYLGTDFGGKLRWQRGIKDAGSEMTLREFLNAAEAVRCELAEITVKARVSPHRRAAHSPVAGQAEERTYAAAKLRELADMVRTAPNGSADTTFNTACFKMGTMVCRDWIAREDVEAALGEAARERGFPPGEIAEKLRRAVGDGIKKPHLDLDARPVVGVKAGGLDATATRGEEVLLGSGIQLFQRSGALVRPVTSEVEAAHGRRTRVAELVRVEPAYLRDLLSRVARWEKYDGRSGRWVQTDPPAETATTILARVGEWSFPVVAGVATTPTMRPDGSLLTKPGYDEATRLLLVEPPPMPDIPAAPSREEALAAVELLENLLADFPFEDDVAKAGALSALITPVVRGAFPVAPMHTLTAPVPGSGKSYLLDVMAAIAIGQPMPVMTAGRTEEETEKRLGANLLTGQPLVSIDNLNGELRSDMLCQIVERPVVEVRILGKSERIRIETRGTTFFATGNNLVVAGDLCRRTIPVRLDPKVERPEQREFRGNPVAAVLADRGKYVASALIVCRAYHAAGRPGRAKPIASFEGWSDTVRSALIWLGKADPVKAMESAREDDPVLGALRAMLLSWSTVIGLGRKFECTLKDVIDAAGDLDGNGAPVWPELNAALQGTARGPRAADARSFGRWAQQQKGRIVDGLSLSNAPNPKGGSHWWVTDKEGTEKEGLRRPGATGARAKGATYAVRVLEKTDNGGLRVEYSWGVEGWLPAAGIIMSEERDDGTVEIEVPERLRKKNNLPAPGESRQMEMRLADMGHCARELDPPPELTELPGTELDPPAPSDRRT
jgi:putative DNA primase/helicase